MNLSNSVETKKVCINYKRKKKVGGRKGRNQLNESLSYTLDPSLQNDVNLIVRLYLLR